MTQSALAELDVDEPIRTIAISAQSSRTPNRQLPSANAKAARNNRNFRFFPRRRKGPLVDDSVEMAAKIAEFIATKGVTKCKPGFAIGVVPSQYEFS